VNQSEECITAIKYITAQYGMKVCKSIAHVVTNVRLAECYMNVEATTVETLSKTVDVSDATRDLTFSKIGICI
jgi:hypothetical protein